MIMIPLQIFCFELAEKYFNDEEIKQRIKDNMEKNLLTKYENL